MYVLIKWLNQNSVTILEESSETENKEVGETVIIYYGKEPFDGKIVSRSGNFNI